MLPSFVKQVHFFCQAGTFPAEPLKDQNLKTKIVSADDVYYYSIALQVKQLVDGEIKAAFHPVKGNGHYGGEKKGSPGSSSKVIALLSERGFVEYQI